jgi:hypothetical protein
MMSDTVDNRLEAEDTDKWYDDEIFGTKGQVCADQVVQDICGKLFPAAVGEPVATDVVTSSEVDPKCKERAVPFVEKLLSESRPSTMLNSHLSDACQSEVDYQVQTCVGNAIASADSNAIASADSPNQILASGSQGTSVSQCTYVNDKSSTLGSLPSRSPKRIVLALEASEDFLDDTPMMRTGQHKLCYSPDLSASLHSKKGGSRAAADSTAEERFYTSDPQLDGARFQPAQKHPTSERSAQFGHSVDVSTQATALT